MSQKEINPYLESVNFTEQSRQQAIERNAIFGLADEEVRNGVVSDEWFLELIQADETALNRVAIAENDYGEFLFVTASRPNADKREVIVFWGLGLHRLHSKYVLDTWRWYYPQDEMQLEPTSQFQKDMLLDIVRARRTLLEELANSHVQSDRGMIYQKLADLAGEEIAARQMEGLDDVLRDLLGE